MRVIVCGAGRVGVGIARRLSREGNDVTVIDQSKELIRKVAERSGCARRGRKRRLS